MGTEACGGLLLLLLAVRRIVHREQIPAMLLSQSWGETADVMASERGEQGPHPDRPAVVMDQSFTAEHRKEHRVRDLGPALGGGYQA